MRVASAACKQVFRRRSHSTNPADFLTRQRFSDRPGPTQHKVYTEPDLALELFTSSGAPTASAFVAACPAAESPLSASRGAPI